MWVHLARGFWRNTLDNCNSSAQSFLWLAYKAQMSPSSSSSHLKEFENTSKQQQRAASPKVTCHFSLRTNGSACGSTWHRRLHTWCQCFRARGMGLQYAILKTHVSPVCGATSCLKAELCPARAGNSYGFVTVRTKFHVVSYRQG